MMRHKNILRQLLKALGAVGLVVMFQGVVELNEIVLSVVHAFQSVTHPIWEALLGWLFRWIDWPFPGWFRNYLTQGTIVTGLFICAAMHDGFWSEREERWSTSSFVFMCWPLIVGGAALLSLKDQWIGETICSRQVFLKLVLWAFGVIAVNYGLVWLKV